MADPRFVVCGDDPLAHSLVDELTTRYHAQVTVVLPSRQRNHGPQIAALRRVRIVEATRLDERTFRSVDLSKADGLALLRQDDAGNIHSALVAQELYPELRMVVRMFNMSLGHAVRKLFDDCAVLSDASMAAPELVAAALGEVAPSFVQLPGRVVYVTRRSHVAEEEVVCGLAATGHGRLPEVLPSHERADLVLAVRAEERRKKGPSEPATPAQALEPYYPDPYAAGPSSPHVRPSAPRRSRSGNGYQPDAGMAVPQPRRHRRSARRRRWFLSLPRALLSLVDSKLEIATVVLAVVFVVGVVAIGVLDQVTPWQALYTTLITAADAGDPELDISIARQVTQTAVAVAGIAMVPVLTATVVNAAVNARLAAATGRLRAPVVGHLVVIGLGNVGSRIIRMLHELGHDVVAVDESQEARGVRIAQELDIPIVLGDATDEETLRRASVRTSRAVLALSSADVVNLEAALLSRALRPDLRLVLRLFDGDFARRVENAFAIPHSRSVSDLAAPAFAAALFERQVIGTIAVQRRVLLVAEVAVADEAALDGRPVSDVSEEGRARVIALTRRLETLPQVAPDPDTEVAAGDHLIVVASRSGLSDVLARTAAPATAD